MSGGRTRFAHLVHADWSVSAGGRWAASATSDVQGRWHAEAPQPVADPLPGFVDALCGLARSGPVLAGFDFPIGLPATYGDRSGLRDFPAALRSFGQGEWADIYRVAERPEEIGLHRPFYPARGGGRTHRQLLDGHGVSAMAALTRRCERAGAGLKAATPLFWTLGAAQVGKGAILGWREVIGPAHASGAHLWPFDGALEVLASRGGLTLAETYPADAYRRLGAAFAPRQSKRRQADRAGKAEALEAWAERRDVSLSPDLRAALREGFGSRDRGGEAFDAVLGLFAMIEAVEGRCPAEIPDDPQVRRWEGWILGRPG